jgi:hypothetical protein
MPGVSLPTFGRTVKAIAYSMTELRLFARQLGIRL